MSGWRGTLDDDSLERLFGDLEVQFELKRRHPQHFAIVAEAAFRAAVFGQAAGEFERQSEQVLHGAFVFEPRESAEVSSRITS